MQTFWRYVKIQLVVFVFGIVGPIFLILFFTTRPDPTMKWAYWAGLIIVFVEVLIALGLTKQSLTEQKAKLSTAELIEQASARRRKNPRAVDEELSPSE
ncbi:hypothetical protein [Mycobacterium sp. NPDC050041]|uniref:hypothetical protein n=1 Tax=Mycobacterium sp. NPDC050041 TaxID=3364293 RepID=UPI003C2FE6DA